MEFWGTLPGWITAIAAVGGVWLAWRKATDELDARREERREEREADREDARRQKQAEVAGQAVLASLRLLTQLTAYAMTWGQMTPEMVSEVKKDLLPGLRKAVAEENLKLWADYRPAMDALTRASELAQTYLPDDANAVLDEIGTFAIVLWGKQREWVHLALGDPEQEHVFHEAFGAGVQAQIGGLRDKLLAKVRPLAQRKVHEPSVLPAKKAERSWFW